MEFRVLGTVEALRDGRSVDLGAFRQRALLALLLTAPNTVFSTDRIIDELWGEDAGPDKHSSLWVYVSGVRTALEPDREKRSEGTFLLTRSPGYLLQVDPDAIDAVRFERLLAEGRALTDTDPAAASLVLGEALALWRGRPFEDFTYESFAQPEIARLEGLRLDAVEARIDADLMRGMSRELVSELESLVREHPLQEHLTSQLMLALYRSGRQADALRSYRLLQARLGEQLGVEPSAQLRQLEGQIVTGDVRLDVGARPTVTGPRPGLAVRGYELRDQIASRGPGIVYRAFQPSVGREVAIEVIRPELANDPGFIRRFEADAQLVARLEQPHIVPLYDYWREPGAAYLVMRLVHGTTLSHLLDDGALPPDRALRVVEQIGGALQAAHRAGVVHRDVTPDHVLIDDDGNAYLADFSIAAGGATGDGTPMYLAPEQLTGGEVTTAADLFALAVVVAQTLTGLRGEIAQIRGALSPAVRRVVDRATATEPWHRHADVAAFVAELRSALGAADVTDLLPPVEVANPYKGLRPFTGSDAADFFGRERLVERLLTRLGEPGMRSRFVAVVGPSGSGKSSVVKAGLLPAVQRGAVAGDWFTVEMTPAPHPFEALEDALLGVAVDPPPSLLEELADGAHGIRSAVDRVLPGDGSRLLLVVDQFEELFTQVAADAADRFLASLVGAVTDPHSRVTVVATLRADFYDRPLRHRGLGELLRDGTELVTPMTADELERAIAGPAQRSGITFAPALVGELINDVIDRAGALPLLQYTLTELFEARIGNRIGEAAYHELGGVSGALVKRAEGLVAGLGEDAREVTRQVFLRLVTLGEGGGDTRRRVLRSELEQLDVERRLLDGVLDTFGRHRLLSFDRDPVTRGPTVEISHESLLSEWTRLRDWIDAARQDVRNQRRLAEAMTEWVTADRSPQYLLRGGRLEQLDVWARTSALPLSQPEQDFLDASIAERDRVATEEREHRQRTAAAEQRAQRRVRQLVALAVVAVIVTGLAVYGFVQQRAATDAKEDVDSLFAAASLVSASRSELTSDPELALLLAVEAVRATDERGFATQEAVDAVHWALQELRVPYDVEPTTPVAVRPGPTGPTGVYALSPAELVTAAESATDRRLTEEECRSYLSGPCPEHPPLPSDQAVAGGWEAYGAVPPGDQALAGTSVLWSSHWNVPDDGLLDELKAFEQRTGIEVDAEFALEPGDDLPDVRSGPQPALLTQLAADGLLLDLSAYLDVDTFRADFGDYLTSLVGGGDPSSPAEGPIYGIPVHADLKGLVFYPKAAFEAAGYEVPATFDELVALSHQIVSDGGTPWCFGFEWGPVSGWPGTDLIESLVLRVGGVEAYDRWSSHDIPFDDPVVVEAGALADSLMFEPGFVRNGPESVRVLHSLEQMLPMLRRNRQTGEIDPQCWLHHDGHFMLDSVPAGTAVGDDVDFFLLPPVDPARPTPTAGGGGVAGAIHDRPEVRALLRFLASPEWGTTWAQSPARNGFLSANARFDVDRYRGGLDPRRDEVRVALGTDVLAALAEGVFRFDASDLMPDPIGSFTRDDTGNPRPGAFFSGMLDWVDGTRSMDEVLADVEAAWVALEAESGGEESAEGGDG